MTVHERRRLIPDFYKPCGGFCEICEGAIKNNETYYDIEGHIYHTECADDNLSVSDLLAAFGIRTQTYEEPEFEE